MKKEGAYTFKHSGWFFFSFVEVVGDHSLRPKKSVGGYFLPFLAKGYWASERHDSSMAAFFI